MSVRALALDAVLRRVIRPGGGVEAELARRRRIGQPPPAAIPTRLARRFAVSERIVDEARVVTLVHRAGGRPGAHGAVVFLPGGGYAHPITAAHWNVAAALAAAAGVDAVVPLYHVAPAGDALRAHALLDDVLDHELSARGAGRVTLAGDSAGGGLALAVLQRRPAGIRAAVLLNPWLDVTTADPAARAIEPWDTILSVDELRQWGRVWADGLAPDDPRVSPLHGRFDDLPPVHVVTGGRDLLLPDALAAHRRLVAAGNAGELVYAPDANHAVGLTGAGTPEGRRARRAVVRWLES